MSTSSKRLSRSVRLAYGFGLSAEGIKNNAFNYFLLFYYQQIVGLHELLCGAALVISLLVDAFIDPMIGIWSDGWKSKLGRRHPFMFAASLPMAVCFMAVFMPPKDAGQAALFAWLTVFAIGTRISMSLFAIPHQSLVAELSSDYDVRTSLATHRTSFAWYFGLLNAVLAYVVFLRDTKEYPRGLLNPDGYLPFAIWGGSAMLVATLISSMGTRKAAILAQPDQTRFRTLTVKDLPKAIVTALRNANYRIVVFVGLCKSVNYGVTETMNNYINTFFWGFTSIQMFSFLIVIFFAAFFVHGVAGRLVQRFGKRNVAMTAALIPALVGPLFVLLRILGLLPPSGSRPLLFLLCGVVFVIYSGIIMGVTMIPAMIADTTDEHELRHGNREEGLLFSANTFMYKASSGVGILIASSIIWLVGFPRGAKPEDIDPDVVTHLGAASAVPNLVLGLAAFLVIRRYALSRERHTEILSELQKARPTAS
jgi:Na+/melibiose symporter-like transporter